MKNSLILLLVALASITCAGDSLEAPSAPAPAVITILKGNNQLGVVGEALPDSFVVQVSDVDGRPVAGPKVEFRIVEDVPRAAVSPEIVTTDVAGRAASRGALGQQPGSWQFEARLSDGLGGTLTTRFTAVAGAGNPKSLIVLQGQDQGERVGSILGDSLVVQVEDAFSNPTPDVEVNWTALGGGSVSAAATRTGADGRAAVRRTLGPDAGAQSTTAAVAGVEESPVTFHHLALAGDASALIRVSGGGQTGKVGTALGAAGVVRVVDPHGNPIPGKTVTWSAGQGGSANPMSSVTGAEGLASTTWTLGGSLGSQTLRATSAGLSSVSFTATATPGPPAQVAIITQPPISAVTGLQFDPQPRLELRDSYGNRTPADGVAIAAELATNPGASLGGTLRATTVAGVATFTDLQLNGTTGSYTLRFTAPGLSPATSAPVSLLAGTPGSVIIQTQPSAIVVAGEPFDRQPVVEVRDGGGNLLDGVPVMASIQTGGGTLSGPSVATTVAGVATYQDLAIGGNSGTRTLRFTAGPAGVTSDPISVDAPPEATAGKWSPVMSSPVVAVHLHLLPDGAVLMYANRGTPHVLQPATGQFTAVPSPANLFCSGHAFLPDGRLLVTGGHITDDHGLPAATIFDYRTRTWTSGPAMAKGRWYPTSTTLANGEVLTVAGADENGLMAQVPEVWTTAGTWRRLTTASRKQPYYPRMFLAPNGRVYDVGPTQTVHYLNTTGTGSWTASAKSSQPYRDYGSAVMYEPGKILIVGGGGLDSNSTPTASAEVIDLNQATPAWRPVQSLQYKRRHLNATLLPTGEVLVTGGTSSGGFNNPAGAVHAAELWSPETEQWTTLASNQVNRLYHATSLLLPDGRVLHSGSGESLRPDELNYEIFSPPYLFKGHRPSISSAPATVGYGQTFSVSTAEAASIAKVTWIRLGSVTHAFDQSQRFNSLAFTRGGGSLSVTAPASGNLAPPGHYMLFVVDGNGVPSVGRIVQIQ